MMAVSSDTIYLSSLEAELQRKRQELVKIQQQVLKAECRKRSQKSRRTGTRTRHGKAAGSSKHESITSNPPSQKSLFREQSRVSDEKAELQELPSSTSSTPRFSYGEAYTTESEIKTPAEASVPPSQLQTTYTPEQPHSSVGEPVDGSVAHPQTADLEGPNQLKRSARKHELEVLSQASNLVRRSQDPHLPIWLKGLSYPAQYLVRQTRSMSAKQDNQSGSVCNSIDGRDCGSVCASGDGLGNVSKSKRRKKACEGAPGEKGHKIASGEEQISSTGSEVGVQNSCTSEDSRGVCSREVSSIVTRDGASTKISTDISDQKWNSSGTTTRLGTYGSSRDVEERCSPSKEGFSGNSLESEACMGMSDLAGNSNSKLLKNRKYISTASLPPTDSSCGGGYPGTGAEGYPCLGETEAIPGCRYGYSSCSHSIKDSEETLKVSIPIIHHFPITVSQYQPPTVHITFPGDGGGTPKDTRAQKRFFPLFSPASLSQEQQLQLSSDFFLPDDSFQALKLLKLQKQQQLQTFQGGRAIRRKARRARVTASSQEEDTSQSTAAAPPLETLDGGSQTQSEGWRDSDSQTGQTGQTSQSSSASQRSNLKPEHSHMHPLLTISLPPSSAAAVESSLPSRSQQNLRCAAGQNECSNERMSDHSETESDSYKRPPSNSIAAVVGKESQICREHSAALFDRDARSPSASLSYSFARTTEGGAVETSELRHRVSLQCASEVKPTAGGKTFRKVKGSLLVAGGGRPASQGLQIGVCLAGALTVYTLAGAWGETGSSNWDNCQRHSWTLGEDEVIHCCCMTSHETDALLSAGGEFRDSCVRIYIAGGCGQYVLKCSSITAKADPPRCTALWSWLSATASHSVMVVAALQSPVGGSEAVGTWTASRDSNLWVLTKYHTLPLPTEVGRVTSLNHMRSHVTRQAEEEKESHDWVVGIGSLTLLLWDATEGTLLQTAALNCSLRAGPALGTQPVGLAAFREESTVFLLLGYQELDPEGRSLPQDSHDLEGCTQPQCSQPPPDTSPQCVCWLLAMNARPSAGEGGGSGCGHPTHCKLVQTYAYPRMMARNPVAMPPVAVCSPSGWPQHLALAVSHDSVLLWDLMHSDPWARLSLSGIDSLQSFYWLDGEEQLFLILDHFGILHAFS